MPKTPDQFHLRADVEYTAYGCVQVATNSEVLKKEFAGRPFRNRATTGFSK